MANPNQTAMQQLINYCNILLQQNQLEQHKQFRIAVGIIKLKVEDDLLEIEKQQIIDAFDGHPLSARESQNGEEYYSKVYQD